MAWMMCLTRRSQATEERLRSSGVRGGQTVLDYACGPGYFSVVAARLVGGAGSVYALDVQPAAADMVAQRARRAGLTNITTITSGCDTGLPHGSIDVVLLYDAIHAIEDKHAVLAELDRVLKPGGVLSVWVEHGEPDHVTPLILENSRFGLHERRGDVLNFTLG
jgi:ubiquinone/menaquinone biosynthesis C-methylase UbiE